MRRRSIEHPSARGFPPWRAAIGALAAMILSACAATDISTDDVKGQKATLPRPDQLIVFDFAVSPDEVKLEHGLIAEVKELANKEPRTEQEKAIGHSVADALAEKLVVELQAKGLPAAREKNVVEPGIRPLQVKGQLLSIDEGNATSRTIVGFGAGRSSVEARIQLYEAVRGRADLIEMMQADTKSGRTPGMGPLISVGGLLGHIVSATALSGAGSAAREGLSDNVDALATTMAKKIAVKIEDFYRERGWN